VKNIHMIAPFHTVPSLRASHCAFTGKALRFAAMMRGFFKTYIEYGNEGSESAADEKVTLLSQKEMEKYYPRKQFWGDNANVDTDGWRYFDAKLRLALAGRVRRGDFIAHPFGRAHQGLVRDYPHAIHVETGIGYPDAPFGAFRVYESWAWAHSHWGRWGNAGLGGEYIETNRTYSWVIPNYFDLREWPVGKSAKAPYALFMGRITDTKGVPTLVAIIRAWCDKHGHDRLRFKVAGQGDWSVYRAILSKHARAVDYLGPLEGKERAPLAGGAVCSMMPTQYVEPFGGSGVEGMLCGTPLLATPWGAFTETVQPGVNGYLCRTIGDWIHALENVLAGKLASRKEIARAARARYSLEACRPKYERVFRSLVELRDGKGAVTLESTLDEG
jgi:glycosyltransferase involved in cell wall biosynthesis